MGNTFFSSDLHFSHTRIIELSRRPFADADEMNHALITNWNSVVTKADDIGWILGDLSVEGSWKAGLEAAKQLNGRLRLITGNHDRAWVGKSDSMKYIPEYAKVFEVVTPWARAKVNGVKVLLSHFPYNGDHSSEDRFDECRLRQSIRPLIHGHVHEKWSVVPSTTKTGTQINVGVDVWDFKPVSVKTLFDVLEADQKDHQ